MQRKDPRDREEWGNSEEAAKLVELREVEERRKPAEALRVA